ncbi:dTDP-glucose 4,6-dehydratase [Candidatus Latescibacterota bacterium]
MSEDSLNTWLVTGGAGFIGTNFVLSRRKRNAARIVTIDKLTYAGNAANLLELRGDPGHVFIRCDIRSREHIRRILREYKPSAVIHFAAESHVDRSIRKPDEFVQTNITGTFALLEETRTYLDGLDEHERSAFRFLHVSTDEVYGSLGPDDPPFTETSPYRPNSPYAASKASADHLVRSYCHTYGLPAIITNCSNNYGPYQFPEKLIPLMVVNALAGTPLPVYGDGLQIRDWLFVGDHCDALEVVLERGRVGETYHIGGRSEKTNIAVVEQICALLDELRPDSPHAPYRQLITFVVDRPGHDRRYAMDTGKITSELNWRPAETFERGLRKTVQWYLDNPAWVKSIQTGAYREWIRMNYEERDRLAPDDTPREDR